MKMLAYQFINFTNYRIVGLDILKIFLLLYNYSYIKLLNLAVLVSPIIGHIRPFLYNLNHHES